MQTTFGITAAEAVAGGVVVVGGVVGGGVVGGGVVGAGVVGAGVVGGAVDGGALTAVPDDSDEPHAIEIRGRPIRSGATNRFRAERSGI